MVEVTADGKMGAGGWEGMNLPIAGTKQGERERERELVNWLAEEKSKGEEES